MFYSTSWSSCLEQFFEYPIFSDQTISELSYNLFVVIERTGRISLAIVLAFDSVTHVIHCAVCVELLLQFSMSDISKCSCNLFLVLELTGRISLASFSNLQCHTRDQLCCLRGVVFVTFLT